MSQLSDDPEAMMVTIAILLRRLGGSVTITVDEDITTPFNLLSKWEEGKLHLAFEDCGPAAAGGSA